MEPGTYWFIAGICFFAGLFFSLFEGALLNFSKSRFEELPIKEKRRKAFLNRMEHSEDYLLSILIYNTITNIVFVLALVQVLPSQFEGTPDVLVFIAGVAAISGIVLFFMELIPRSLGERMAEKVILRFLFVVESLHVMIKPLGIVVKMINRVIHRAAGAPENNTPAEEIEDDILDAIDEGEREGIIKKGGRDMIEGIISIHDMDVGQIMTPRTDMVTIEAKTTLDEAVKVFMEKGHSRVPIHEQTRDKIIGILFAKDLLKSFGRPNNNLKIRDIMREPVFVPETKQVSELLTEMQSMKIHLMVVLDEYGGTAGLITIEDIIEEIVGEIADEYDLEEEEIFKPINENEAVVEARCPIHELNGEFGTNLPEDEDYDTVGGFLSTAFGKIPAKGENYTHENAHFTIIEADERRVKKVRLKVLEKQPRD